MRHLGIDFGSKRVGLALSDEAGTMGFPHGVVKNDTGLISTLAVLLKEKQVQRVVIGESRNSAGVENPIAKEARIFGEALNKETGVPIAYELEAFSTQEARRDIEGNRGAGDVDAAAAALILTSYLSRHHDND